MGAWVNYGLGSECHNLPGLVVLNGGLIPPGGLDCLGSGYLPASYYASVFKPSGNSVVNINPSEATPRQQREKLHLINQLNGLAKQQFGRTPFAQGQKGRDQNQFGFTIWLAGGGAKRA